MHDAIWLEACVENTSRSPLVLDYLRFDPQPQMSVEEVKAVHAIQPTSDAGPLKEYMQTLKVRLILSAEHPMNEA